MADKQHYFMIAGLVGIVVTTEEDGVKSENPTSLPGNAVVRHDSTNFPAHRLGRAQQNLTRAVLTKIPEEVRPTISIMDVVIQNVSYLGFMTEEEFQAPAPDLTPLAPADVI